MIKYSHRTSGRNRNNSIHSSSRTLVLSIASQVSLLEIKIIIWVIYRQLKMVIAAMKLKDTYSLEGKL